MINIGVIGCGYWGPKLIRTFQKIPGVRVVSSCDCRDERLRFIRREFPHIKSTSNYRDLLKDPILDAFVIATPLLTHFKIAKDALLYGKHVFIEKPLTSKVEEAEELIRLKRKKKRILMVGHIFEYHPVINVLKDYIRTNKIGCIFYIYAIRTHLGPAREDINVLWELGPHDISILLYLLGKMPYLVSTKGLNYEENKLEDVIFITLSFPDNITAHIQASWSIPQKRREIIVVGDKRTIVFDDMKPHKKLFIYDPGISLKEFFISSKEIQITPAPQAVEKPDWNKTQPLEIECAHFIECIKKKRNPRSDGKDGLNVVKILTAAQKSLELNGKPIEIRSKK